MKELTWTKKRNNMTALECLVKNDVLEKPEISNFNLRLTRDCYIHTQNSIHKAMIEFAQFHVQEALKKGSNETCVMKRGDFGSYPVSRYEGYRVDEDAILKAYPLENIK